MEYFVRSSTYMASRAILSRIPIDYRLFSKARSIVSVNGINSIVIFCNSFEATTSSYRSRFCINRATLIAWNIHRIGATTVSKLFSEHFPVDGLLWWDSNSYSLADRGRALKRSKYVTSSCYDLYNLCSPAFWITYTFMWLLIHSLRTNSHPVMS